MTRTSRRSRALLLAGIASLALSSCGIVGNPSEAFSVDGTAFPRKDLNSLVKALADADQLTVVNEVAQSKDLLGILEVVIQYRAGKRMLEQMGKPVTDADLKAVREKAVSQLPPSMPSNVVDLLVDINATGQALDKFPAPAAADLEKMYSSDPASTGFLCVREITVATQDEARAVVDGLGEGQKFEDLARKHSIDKRTKDNGGAVLSGTGLPCQGVSRVAADESAGPALVRALIDTKPGTSTGVVKAGNTWKVAVHRPYQEVKDALASGMKDTPGRSLTAGVLATADIKVNSAYGTWNPATAKVE